MHGAPMWRSVLAAALTLVLLAVPAAAQTPVGTAFTYQGQLKSGGAAYSGSCDFQFGLWSAESGGSQLGATLTRAGVSVTDGYFTVSLDFGGGRFAGDARWLAIAVRCPAGSGGYTALAPRQPLTPSPYALWAAGAPWSGLSGLPAGFADGADNDTTYSAGAGLALSGGAFSLATAYRLPQGCSSGQIAEWNGSAWICAADDIGGGGGGDITGVTAGTGLSGGGLSGDVALALDTAYADGRYLNEGQAGSVSAAMLQDGAALAELTDDDGAGSGLDADLLDGQHAAGFAAAGHNHWGETWTGSGTGTGLTLSGGTIGLLGTGTNYGLYGESISTTGRGVYGWAAAASGTTYGLYGESYSTAGRGVYGYATAGSGTTYGLYGQSLSTSGKGVFGLGTRGVHGESYSTTGMGVYGYAYADTGTTHGVLGESCSPEGRGVSGKAYVSSGTTYGVSGESASTAGRGVYGSATASSGATYGVYGESASTSGRGVYGHATAASGATHGVQGHSDSTGGTGVWAWVTAASGNTYGVWSKSLSTSGTGVYGWASATSGTTHGVYGQSASPAGQGVHGEATSTGGGHGVYAHSKGSAMEGAALWAQADHADGIAIWARNSSADSTLVLENLGSGDLIRAFIPGDQLRFQVTNSGDVYADGTLHTPASDFAEMLPAVAGLEPADLLAVAPDGALVRSSQPYQASVVGVYSTRPGFLGGAEDSADLAGQVPLAVVGVVPVKATAENGHILPGDLLVSSSMPGHAMRAGPNPPVGTVVGKALGGLDGGAGLIQMLVTLQ